MKFLKNPWKTVSVLVMVSLAACNGGNRSFGKNYSNVAPSVAADALLIDANPAGNYEIYKVAGGMAQQLTNDGQYDSWWAKASPGGTTFLFYRTPRGVHDRDYGKTSLWMANIDGSNVHQVLPVHANNWPMHGHAEWSPDGSKLVMFGGAGIVITDTNGNVLGQVANGIDPSWSANGQQIVYISCDNYPKCGSGKFRVYIANADGSGYRQFENLDRHANDPYMSPDGRYVSWISSEPFHFLTWDLMIANADGSNAHPLVSDGNINSKPNWSADGLVYFHKTEPGLYKGFSVWSVHTDGTELTWVGAGMPPGSEYPAVIPLR